MNLRSVFYSIELQDSASLDPERDSSRNRCFIQLVAMQPCPESIFRAMDIL